MAVMELYFMMNRLAQLYRDGGFYEVKRGVLDFVFTSKLAPYLSRLYNQRSLIISNNTVIFNIVNQESLKRSTGHGEQKAISDFVSEVSDKDVVWDVGANQGTYSLFAARTGAEVHAFEPGTSACSIFQKNIETNDLSIELHKIALGSKNQKKILRSASRSGVRWVADTGPGEEIEVHPGDELNITPPTVVKIDVEGAELDVLKGMKNQLMNSRVCFVESHSQNEEEVKKILSEYGFSTKEVFTYGETMIKADRI